MLIRPYRPGDEEAQAHVFNDATRHLPAFKPATAEEIVRRRQVPDADLGGALYAVDDDSGEVAAYALFNPNGRVSVPWCLPGREAAQAPLMDAILDEMRARGLNSAWAAYRADWSPVHEFLESRGFRRSREMVNYIAETDRLPGSATPAGMTIGRLLADDLPQLVEIGRGLFAEGPERLKAFYWDNPYIGPDDLYAIRPTGGGPIEGAGLVVARDGFADPTKVDPAMPCFRLGGMGNEAERLKRITGVVSFAFTEHTVGNALLGEATRRLKAAGLAKAAAQAPSNQPELLAFYDTYFERQGAFPILDRRLD